MPVKNQCAQTDKTCFLGHQQKRFIEELVCYYHHETRGYIDIKVVDTGIGITQEGISKLMKPFAQADSEISKKYGGTGLGLWLSQQIITLFEGEIVISSEEGQGSTFSIGFPIEPAPLKKKIPEPTERCDIEKFQEMFSGSHVVIAEDLTLNAKIMECSIKTLGCKTTKVKNGKDLVKLYIEKNQLIDYVITDILMPELDGIEAIRQIREFEMLHSLMKIPIIALTGNATAKMKQAAFQAGVSEFLIKPISIKQVAKTFLEAAPTTGTILLVDDDRLCLEINKQMLSGGGYSIRQA